MKLNHRFISFANSARCCLALWFLSMAIGAENTPLELRNEAIVLQWVDSAAGWRLQTATVQDHGHEVPFGTPSGEYTVLFADTVPPEEGNPAPWRGRSQGFPETTYKHTTRMWRQAVGPIALNTAGTATTLFPSVAKRLADGSIEFQAQCPVADIEAVWQLSPDNKTDVLVTLKATARRGGYFSLGSPTLAMIAPSDLGWAMVPGVFAGARLEPDLVTAYGYGQGVPERPVLARERSASTLMALVATRGGATSAVIAEPGTAEDPWAYDHNTRQVWRLGLSHMNRQGRLAPTLWHPVLGQEGSYLAPGEMVTFRFRYSLRTDGWYAALQHAAYDVYRLNDFLALRSPAASLTRRLERLHRYITNPTLSHWCVEDFQGEKIGAQFYGTPGARSGVVGSDADAIKNSDYGAMWMLAALTGDPHVINDRLPYARAFKFAQQQTTAGFFQGAAVGQYYLFKSHRFVEEWGNYIEPVGLTYYTLCDLGNMLLFNPRDEQARARLRLGADKLLSWQFPDGHWEVAYDRRTEQPVFTDLHDYRPTFYGLFVAWRILGDQQYLDGAIRGADWLVRNAVEPHRFLGVCGDARFAPDFATGQIAQGLLDLADATGDARYREAGIATARFYATSVYTHPLAGDRVKQVGQRTRADWEISQMGLSFEHGGTLGSANTNGPILLASHAGLFLRVAQLTGDPLLRDLARAAAFDRDAFVNPETGVASYYWIKMDEGAGSYPHHAWWQIGWITDYLISEAALRSHGAITFPHGFFTPKVGPHVSYGFAPGTIFGERARLAWSDRDGDPAIDVLSAVGIEEGRHFTIVMNETPRPHAAELPAGGAAGAELIQADGTHAPLAIRDGKWKISLPAWGVAVITTGAPENIP